LSACGNFKANMSSGTLKPRTGASVGRTEEGKLRTLVGRPKRMVSESDVLDCVDLPYRKWGHGSRVPRGKMSNKALESTNVKWGEWEGCLAAQPKAQPQRMLVTGRHHSQRRTPHASNSNPELGKSEHTGLRRTNDTTNSEKNSPIQMGRELSKDGSRKKRIAGGEKNRKQPIKSRGPSKNDAVTNQRKTVRPRPVMRRGTCSPEDARDNALEIWWKGGREGVGGGAND